MLGGSGDFSTGHGWDLTVPVVWVTYVRPVRGLTRGIRTPANTMY